MMDIVSTVYVSTHKQTSCICVRAKKIEKKKNHRRKRKINFNRKALAG